MEPVTPIPTSGSNKLITYFAIALGAIIMILFLLFLIGKLDQKKTAKYDNRNSTAEAARTSGQDNVINEGTLNDFEQYLSQAVSEVNRRCPMMVDQETRLDNAIALPGNEFQYNYTLINTSSNSIDVSTVESLMRPTLLNMIKTTPELKVFRDYRTTMSYSYKDRSGLFLFKLSFRAEEYLN